jgi:hypothetical protein
MIQFAHRLVAESMATAREEANALAIAADEQPIAIVLDFMDPMRAGRRLVGENRDAPAQLRWTGDRTTTKGTFDLAA